MLKKSLIALISVALAVALAACEDENKAEMSQLSQKEVPPVQVKKEAPIRYAFKAKIRKVVGEIAFLHNGSKEWKSLRIGQKVVDMDRIRTAKESETQLAVNDGSVLTISENSDVIIDAGIIDELYNRVAITINNGKVYFDVQKQKSGNTLKFKTGTATAAIRGTAGFVGSVNGQMVASLKEGRLEVTSDANESSEIVENQTIIMNRTGKSQFMKLKSSGTQALAQALDSIVVASTQQAEVDEKSLQNSLEKFDKIYEKRQNAFAKKVYFKADVLPDSIFNSRLTINAKVTPGVFVTILGNTVQVGEDSVLTQEFDWASDEYGQKRFLVSCGDGEVEIPCSMLTTVYADSNAVMITADEIVSDTVLPKKRESKIELSKENIKKEDSKSANVKVSIAGAAKEKIHHPFGRNPRVPGFRGKVFKTNLHIKLSGVTNDQLGEIASVKVFRNGSEDETLTSFSSTSISVPVEIEVNTAVDYEVVVTTKTGVTSKAKKSYEVFCNARAHNPNDLTKYMISDMNEEKEYEEMAPKLKRN